MLIKSVNGDGIEVRMIKNATVSLSLLYIGLPFQKMA